MLFDPHDTVLAKGTKTVPSALAVDQPCRLAIRPDPVSARNPMLLPARSALQSCSRLASASRHDGRADDAPRPRRSSPKSIEATGGKALMGRSRTCHQGCRGGGPGKTPRARQFSTRPSRTGETRLTSGTWQGERGGRLARSRGTTSALTGTGPTVGGEAKETGSSQAHSSRTSNWKPLYTKAETPVSGTGGSPPKGRTSRP